MKNPWIRILLFLLSSLGMVMVVILILALIDRDFILQEGSGKNAGLELFYYFVVFAAIAVSIIVFNERAMWRNFVLTFSTKEFLFGCLLALIILTPVIICLAAFQTITIQPQPNNNFLFQLVSFTLVALIEELLNRGFILETLKNKYSPLFAIIASSLIFALLHIFNDHLSIIGMINLTLSGVIFSLLYLRSGNLWAAIGMHFFWNVFQGPIFGFNVSGNEGDSFLAIEYLSSTDIITGGAFGLEGSILLVLSQAFCCLYLLRERPISFALRGISPSDIR